MMYFDSSSEVISNPRTRDMSDYRSRCIIIRLAFQIYYKILKPMKYHDVLWSFV